MLQRSKGQLESHCFVPGKIKLLSLVESAAIGLNVFLLPVLPSDGDFRVWGRPSDRWIRHRSRRTTLLETRAPKYFILELIFSLLSSSSLFFTNSRVRITQTMLVENIISFLKKRANDNLCLSQPLASRLDAIVRRRLTHFLRLDAKIRASGRSRCCCWAADCSVRGMFRFRAKKC